MDKNLTEIKNEFVTSGPSIVLCSEPFLKIEFLNKCMNVFNENVIFLDFDLLYSGYVVSHMIKENEKVEIFRPERETLKKIISETMEKISKEKFLVIIDSFNGLNNFFDGKEYSRLINSIIMLLVSAGNHTDSIIMITAMARKKDDRSWVLSPGGRHILDSKKSRMFLLKKNNNSFMINSLNQNSGKYS